MQLPALRAAADAGGVSSRTIAAKRSKSLSEGEARASTWPYDALPRKLVAPTGDYCRAIPSMTIGEGEIVFKG
jgi:hypothetical protein